MKAVHCTKYGGPNVLAVKNIDKPVPRNNEILVKVMASSVTTADTMMRRGTPFYARFFLGLTKPKNPVTGTGYAGEVVEVGKLVSEFQPGDKVFGESGMKLSTNAEFVTVLDSSLIVRLPEKLDFDTAAPMCDGPLTSMNFLKNIGTLERGQRLLVNGASGSLGTAAVQIGKALGAHVTGVCSANNVILVKSLGADVVIDYTRMDFTTGHQHYDLIFDTVGKSSFRRCKSVLADHGSYLSPVLSLSLMVQMLATSRGNGKKAKFSATGLLPVPELKILIADLLKLIDDDKLKVIIDRRYALDDVAEAHAYTDTGRKKGNVVLIPGMARS